MTSPYIIVRSNGERLVRMEIYGGILTENVPAAEMYLDKNKLTALR